MKRKQVTVHIDDQTKQWLQAYAAGCGLKESELLRILIQRESQTEYFSKAFEKTNGEEKRASEEIARQRG